VLNILTVTRKSFAVCTDAVRCNRITSGATNDEVERIVREWLRTAKDRNGGRRRREKNTGAQQLVDAEIDPLDSSFPLSQHDETDEADSEF
jgi:hypothetical protein